MWPHHPRTAQLREFLEGGTLGPIQRASGAFTFRLSRDTDNIRLQPSLAGGSLLDVGCYPVYGIRWAFAAEPVRVQAHARFEHGVDVEMNGSLWFADGRVATFDCGFIHPFRQWLELTCSEGVAFVPDMWLPPARAVVDIRKDGTYHVEELAVEGHDQIVHMIENFSRAVLDDQPVTPSPEEAVKTLRVLDALAESAREGKAVEVATNES